MDRGLLTILMAAAVSAGLMFVAGCGTGYEQDKLSYGIVPPTHLYRIEESGRSDEELVLIQTLQGVVAQTKPEIFIDEGRRNHIWLIDMVDNYGITYETQNSISWYLDHFKSRLTGYILYDMDDAESLNAATSLAGILKAVAVDVGLESLATDAGLTMLQDVRGKNDTWVWDNYGNQFTLNALINQNPGNRFPLRDWGPAIKAYTFWNPTYSDYPAFSATNDSTPMYGGWVGLDEHGAIAFYGNYGLYTIPSDWVYNLSTYAGMANYTPEITFQQKIRGKVYTPESNVHYVAFLLSDTDNLCPIVDSFPTNRRYYGSPYRGEFAMGWGMPAILAQVGPTIPAWYYREATDKDGFVVPASGMGVMYPAEFPNAALADHWSQLEKYMEILDLKVVHMIDWVSTLDDYNDTIIGCMNIDDVLGVLYIDYGDYDRWEGDIKWFGGKPLVTARYKMWDAADGKSPAEVISLINNLPTTPENENGYTFVIVHAWSYGLTDVKTVIDNLDADVRVVNPEEFIEQLYLHNVGP